MHAGIGTNTEDGHQGAPGQGRAADDEGQVEAADLVEDAAQERADHQPDAEHRLHHGQDGGPVLDRGGLESNPQTVK